jgi:hypothetical protein
MKKIGLLFIAMVIAIGSQAQGVSFGLKAGLNFANQDFEAEGFSISPDARTAFHVGAFATIMFSETFGFQPELMYNGAGSKWKAFGDEATIKMDYLSLPLLLRYQPIELLNLHAGPQFSYLLSAEADGEDFKDDAENLEIGLAFGAGVDLPMGIGFTARYVLGLSNAMADSFGEDVTVKNNIIQLSVTFRFGNK